MHLKNTQFGLNEEQEAVLDAADKFGKKELYPLAEKMDNEEWWPEGIFKKMGDAGLVGLTVDPKFGGAGMSYLQAGLVCQAFGRWNHAMALSWVAHDNLCLDNIYRNGSQYIREKYLPGLCSGKLVGALGLTEPGAGSDALGSMRTIAKKEGDHYVLNGSKTYITNGSIADVVIVYAKTDVNKGNKGITAFVVETNNPGFKVVSKLKKMGFRGSQTSELFFENLKVSEKIF
jgi:isovaleryl-CoA dehydrogenase